MKGKNEEKEAQKNNKVKKMKVESMKMKEGLELRQEEKRNK
jgi:hypothetical protein